MRQLLYVAIFFTFSCSYISADQQQVLAGFLDRHFIPKLASLVTANWSSLAFEGESFPVDWQENGSTSKTVINITNVVLHYQDHNNLADHVYALSKDLWEGSRNSQLNITLGNQPWTVELQVALDPSISAEVIATVPQLTVFLETEHSTLNFLMTKLEVGMQFVNISFKHGEAHHHEREATILMMHLVSQFLNAQLSNQIQHIFRGPINETIKSLRFDADRFKNAKHFLEAPKSETSLIKELKDLFNMINLKRHLTFPIDPNNTDAGSYTVYHGGVTKLNKFSLVDQVKVLPDNETLYAKYEYDDSDAELALAVDFASEKNASWNAQALVMRKKLYQIEFDLELALPEEGHGRLKSFNLFFNEQLKYDFFELTAKVAMYITDLAAVMRKDFDQTVVPEVEREIAFILRNKVAEFLEKKFY